jgi:hypothetical protein
MQPMQHSATTLDPFLAVMPLCFPLLMPYADIE